jgi:hypothetical protein
VGGGLSNSSEREEGRGRNHAPSTLSLAHIAGMRKKLRAKPMKSWKNVRDPSQIQRGRQRMVRESTSQSWQAKVAG